MIANTIAQALEAEQPTYVGGGTDLMPLFKNRVRDSRELVFLGELEELKGIRHTGGCLYIGAAETLTSIAGSELVRRLCPAVAQAAAATASLQIRNIATLGGNIMQDRRCIYYNQSLFWRSALPLCFKTGGSVCHQIPNSPVCRAIYYSDVATALVMYQAEAELIENGRQYWLSVEELIARHSQANGLSDRQRLPILVLRFRIPEPPERECSGFYKYAMRASIDFPLINFALRCGGSRPARVVAGAVAPAPVLLEKTADMLNQESPAQEAVISCCEAELKTLALPIREACIPPQEKRELYKHISYLLKRLL